MKITTLLCIAGCATGAVACSDREPSERDLPPASSSHEGGERTSADPQPATAEGQAPRRARATFESVDGIALEGSVDLRESPTGVALTAHVRHAPPGEHGFHVHEVGDCSDIAGKSMGGHFAPDGHQHGFPGAAEHHLGDLGNLSVDDDGEGTISAGIDGASLVEGERKSLVGKAVVIHEGADDGTGSSGNAGQPIACAVIVKSE